MTVKALPKTMKAARFYAPGDVRIEPCTLPGPQSGELLIEIEIALTCGTDLKAYKRGHPVLLGEKLPAPFGHECVGKIVAIGPNVTQFKMGDRVVPANSAPCETCYFCTHKQFTQCESLTLLNGAYAEYLLIPERIASKNTYKVPSTIKVENLACAEILAVCLRGINACKIQADTSIAILGSGPIGQIMARLSKQIPQTSITILGRNQDKLLALKNDLGLQAHLTLEETHQADWKKLTPSQKGFDVVIEAIGLPETWEKAMTLVRPGGTVLFFGGCPQNTTVELSTHQLHYQEVSLVSTFHHTPADFSKAVQMLTENQIDLSFLITETQPLSQLSKAFEKMDQKQACKIAILPDKNTLY